MRIGLRGPLGLVTMALAGAAAVLPLSAPQVAAQGTGTWTRQTAPAAGQADLQGVYFINATTGWAVGGSNDSTDTAVALWTTDGGTTWNPATINGTKQDLYAVHFISATVGYAVGNSDAIFVSTDGGITWNHIGSEPEVGSYKDIHFGDAQHGCAVGAAIVCTTDGGTTWTALTGNQAPACTGMEGISYGSASTAYVVGACGILKSTNANSSSVSSITFTKVSDPPGTAAQMADVSCADATHCTVVGDEAGSDPDGNGTVAVTTDGSTFTPQTTCRTGMGLEAVNFRAGDATNGWMGGLQDSTEPIGALGQLCDTTNSGGTWSQSITAVNDVKDIWFVDSCHGWMVSESTQLLTFAAPATQPRAPAAPQLAIYAFTDNCPAPASSIAPIGLPKSGGPASQAGADMALLIAAATALGLLGLGSVRLARRG